ncbi:hypothetical protein HHK36_026290 [Tetracentron sinense]|uniref:Protein kinase domain-containing protein n=1 Tax=Tetracentron sinense TaxID=13715 RepID=A0A834YJY3_TETSI|nr:hypothetical protein HHK36_026290 [Tetracentron sinense]
MSDFADLFSNSDGMLKKIHWLILEYLLIISSMAFIVDAELPNYLLETPLVSPTGAPFVTPAIPDLPLPVNPPLFHRPHRRHFSPHGAPLPVLMPAQPPDYGPLTTSSHPPSSSRLSKPLMKRSQLPPPSVGLIPPHLSAVAPMHSNAGTIPSGLVQSPLSPHIADCCGPDMVLKQGSRVCHCVYPIKLDLLLLNVSLSSNWSPFQEELASQLGLRVSQFEIINFYVLGLSRLNISMDITPHTGISFSASDVSAINSSLAMHKIHLDPKLVGDYKLLNLTWFEPPAPSQVPADAASPTAASPHPSSHTPRVTANRGKHPNWILILGIGAGFVIVIIISVLVIYSCTSGPGRKNAHLKETGSFRDWEEKSNLDIGKVVTAGGLGHQLSLAAQDSEWQPRGHQRSLAVNGSQEDGGRGEKDSTKMIFGSSMFSSTGPQPTLLDLLLVLLIAYLKMMSWKPRTANAVPIGGSLPHPTSTRFLAYEELKEATNNFESASVLGEGGFGRVFKGVLSDGTAVAIKKLTSGGHQGDKEFLVEVEMLSRLHHRNLVKLVGYYNSCDSLQNLLCYELVPNGSLEAWLHGPLGVNCPLDWDTRMKIALDAARGLAYLHEDSQPCVIHRDFKASNILLENNFHAKVADFGLAKQAPEGQANYLSTRVMGTFGYVAPEYAMTGHLLVKSDVYSYGVVLLELLTGRKAVDMSQPSGQENLVNLARPILRDKDRLEELADPRLAGKYPKDDFLRVCTIAAACVSPEVSQRPTMGEVVQSLKMVQRITEYQDSMLTTSNTRPNLRQSSTTYESDGTSSMFSSGPFFCLSTFDNDNISRTAVFSEDLHEGR